MENPTASDLAVPPKSAFCVHTSVEGSYSQKSFFKGGIASPVPMYPLLPMENPTGVHLATPPKLAFCVHVSVTGSYSQKSLYTLIPSKPVPIYPLLPIA